MTLLPRSLAHTVPLLTMLAAVPGLALADPLDFRLQASSARDLGHPHDIVLSPEGELLYVADNGRHRVAILDAETLAEVGELGVGELREPHDVAFDPQGRLLVADTGNSRIAVYRVSAAGGSLVGELRGSIRRPEGVAVHPDGRVFATGAASNNLVVFQDGRATVEVGGFSAPHDVAIAPDGSVWVADADHDRLVQLDSGLRVSRVLEGPEFRFRGPRYLDFDAAGRMFVADKYSHSIKIVGRDGRLLQVLGTGTAGVGEGTFDRPEGVAISGTTVWFSDTYNDRVVRYRMSGR